MIEIEAEAIVGAAASRRDYCTANKREKARGYARAVAVGDVVHVSGCTSADPAGAVRAPGRLGGAVRYLPRGHRGSAGDGGAILNDVIQRRSFTIASAEQNRPYGEGPAWSKDSWPVSMGCRIGLASVDRAGMLAASRHQRSGRTCISIQISPISLSSTIRWFSIS